MLSYPKAFKLQSTYRHYVWGGKRLKEDDQPVAEAWVIHAQNRVTCGSFDGKSLEEVTRMMGEAMLGQGRSGDFPLLIKLIDSAQWLSLQVHPNDEQAKNLEGERARGKLEAWHILDAGDEGSLIAGFKPEVTKEEIIHATGHATMLDLVQKQQVTAGDTIIITPGTLHAIGPGLLIYEVQQSSDLTYRVYDWDRPQVNGRVLHVDKARQVLDPHSGWQIKHLAVGKEADKQTVAQCEYFRLELLQMNDGSVGMDTKETTFHAITIIEGSVDLIAGGETTHLEQFDSILVPACCGAYELKTQGRSGLLLASLT